MVLLVPFDGSDLSQAALERATEFARYRDEEILVLSVVPDAPEFALDRGWLNADETFSTDLIAEKLEAQAREIGPDIRFRCEVPEDVSSMASITTDVIRTIRSVANEENVSIVFIGSENAGRVSTPVSSVGAPVSEDPQYDVHIVRHA